MNLVELDAMLKVYSEEELLYRKNYDAKKDRKILQVSMDNLDMDLIKELTEADYFSSSDRTDIIILKHKRFTPVFKHRHEFFELIYVYAGHCVQEINGEVIQLRECDLCIIPPKVEHTIEVFDDSIILNVLIKRSTFKETFLEMLKHETVLSSFFMKILYTEKYNNYIIFRTNRDPNLKEILSKLFIEHHDNKKYTANILYNLLMLFFSYLLREYESQVELPKSLPKNDKLISILAYMQDHYKTVTLGELSSTFHFTESYLSKLIKVTSGQTFLDIIKTIKLNKAIELLTSSDLKVQNISESIGFENNTHFIRTFKKVYGISPNQFRKNSK
ncbi:AraC family transcriptional regulator [Paenibacillus psychroresistens]|uniref:AraC family transcriptional regulator n=1 Tax=Paenibacillus psychroresistens TaxID=1778678 RepID=A0A6B8RUS5_9BACL|nr:AraC family transcriptional regulator [Paenibacillus psychroresistens]QGQ99203.1 AraC family transcriptional regulator [Paenibacillus psychroresistens]